MDLKNIKIPDLKKMDKGLISKLFMFILFIIIIFAAIIIIKLIKGNRISYEKIEEKMIIAAKEYYSEDEKGIEEFKDISNKEISVDIETLIENGYLKDITKLTPNKEAVCKGKVRVKTNNNYTLYTAFLDCGEDYKTKYLSDVIKKNTVETGDGLYVYNDAYIFRGENVNNYVKFADKEWRIIRINNDNTIRMIETTIREEIVWDNRYNVDTKAKEGINEFNVSRIKDSLEELYNNNEEFDDNAKSHIVPQNLCVGKRANNDSSKDGRTECSKTEDNFTLGLLQVNEYALASLDNKCISPNDKVCQNYNYLSGFKTSYWSITANADKTNKVYKFVNTPMITTANNTSRIRVVINIDANSTFATGDGTKENPYIIK